jgi:hypothetical protein
MRPFSAHSRQDTISNLSSRKRVSYIDKIQGVIKRGRGLGFFGDDADRIRRIQKQKEFESGIKVNTYTA